jgi:hypothetical protein
MLDSSQLEFVGASYTFLAPYPTTDMLPVMSVAPSKVAPVPADFLDIQYSPALLLDGRFHISIVADAAFSEFCEIGFNAYFHEMASYELASNRVVFTNRFYCWDDVKSEVVREVIIDGDKYGERLPVRVSFTLGWLSALALTDLVLAQAGLELLVKLVASLRGAVC